MVVGGEPLLCEWNAEHLKTIPWLIHTTKGMAKSDPQGYSQMMRLAS
jgi:hypothetical protein